MSQAQGREGQEPKPTSLESSNQKRTEDLASFKAQGCSVTDGRSLKGPEGSLSPKVSYSELSHKSGSIL